MELCYAIFHSCKFDSENVFVSQIHKDLIIMDSQASVSSSTSTVPLDLIHDQDNDFVDEIDEVDRIYFGNIEINLRDDISYSDLNDGR
jgi:hypothetical protein